MFAQPGQSTARRGVKRYDNGQVELLYPSIDPSLHGDKNELTLAIYDRMNAQNRDHCVEKLVAIHMGLVFGMAKQNRFKRRGLDFADRVQEGFIGLMTAIKLFNPSRGVRFSTFATFRIRQAIGNACWASGFNGRAARSSRSADEFTLHVITEARHISLKLGREPTDFELVDVMHDPKASKRMTRERFLVKVRDARKRAAFRRLELDAPIDRMNAKSQPRDMADDRTISADLILEAHDLVNMCRRILLAHDPQLANIFDRQFPVDRPPESLVDIARDLGVHRVTASDLVSKVLRYLKHELDVTREEINNAIAICSMTL
ncbi:MAG: sigma-70 family RNA polymerase sigma factor [Patescibacteria group bacterium]